jgi:hypothetical protein
MKIANKPILCAPALPAAVGVFFSGKKHETPAVLDPHYES